METVLANKVHEEGRISQQPDMTYLRQLLLVTLGPSLKQAALRFLSSFSGEFRVKQS
jgi:hypothetical protein